MHPIGDRLLLLFKDYEASDLASMTLGDIFLFVYIFLAKAVYLGSTIRFSTAI